MDNRSRFRVQVFAVLVVLASFSCLTNGSEFSRTLLEASAPGGDAGATAPSGAAEAGAPSGAAEAGAPSGDAGAGAPGGDGGVGAPGGDGGTVFDVTKFGAKADDKTDNADAFQKAWKAACDSTTPGKLLIPAGKFVTGPVTFEGPCKADKIAVEVQGYVTATTDLSQYTKPRWISFDTIKGLTLNGKGTFDGQGASAWKNSECAKAKTCAPLPDNLKFFKVDDSDVSEITSLNSKYFHFHVVECNHVKFHHLNMTAPGDSPNTDGIHLSRSTFISVTSSVISTGDDCVSIGQGTRNLTVHQVTCGPGHGISVGSLGKYKNEDSVSGIFVTNCTISDTTNGARIKTYPGSDPSEASTIIFDDIIMNNVKNPVIIDQHYGSKSTVPSKVKLNDVHFRNIKGTSASPTAITLECSSAAPCDQVELADIKLASASTTASLQSTCANAQVKTAGVLTPVNCGT